MNDTINTAVNNLNKTSDDLLAFSNKPENYNHPLSNMLASIAYEMRKVSAELREIDYMGGF